MNGRDHAERRADAAARRAAQRRFDAPLVLEAGAGTGKTTVLVARILAWSVGPGWERATRALAGGRAPASDETIAERVLGRVAAITFTEAAAAEMESRAMQAYAALAAGQPVVGFDAAPEDVAPERIRPRARALLGAFDHLHVQTIHAFCRRLLAAHPLEAGLHPRFAIDARGNARAAVAREVVEECVRAMGERGDVDLETLLHEGIGAAEIEAILRGLLEVAVPAEAFAADPLDAARVAAWSSQLREAAAAVAAAEGGRFEGTKGNATAIKVMDAVATTLDALAGDVALAARIERLRDVWTAPARRTSAQVGPRRLRQERARDARRRRDEAARGGGGRTARSHRARARSGALAAGAAAPHAGAAGRARRGAARRTRSRELRRAAAPHARSARAASGRRIARALRDRSAPHRRVPGHRRVAVRDRRCAGARRAARRAARAVPGR